MRARFGDKVRLNLIAPRRNWLRERFGVGDGFMPGRVAGGEAWIESAITAIEDRMMWNRFGL